ncbi:hypothetical protein R6Q59_019292 [Mikania micrantha]
MSSWVMIFADDLMSSEKPSTGQIKFLVVHAKKHHYNVSELKLDRWRRRYVRRQASHGPELVTIQETVTGSASLGRVQPMELVMFVAANTSASATSINCSAAEKLAQDKLKAVELAKKKKIEAAKGATP